jgi:hypothetical protein
VALGDRLDPGVGDTRVGEQQRDAQVPQALQFGHVGGRDLEPGDDQHVVGVAAPVEGVQDGEQVRAHPRQEWVGGLVQELDRGGVRLAGGVAGQQVHRLLVGAQQVRGLDLEVSPEVANAVAAVQRAADDVVQTQVALAVPDD